MRLFWKKAEETKREILLRYGSRVFFTIMKLWLFIGACFFLLFSLDFIKTALQLFLVGDIMDQMQSYFVSLEKSFSVGLLFSVIAMGGGPVTALGISLESIRAISSLQLGFIIIGTLMAPKIIFLISSLMEYISGKWWVRSFGFPIADILIPLFLGVIALITLPLVFDMHLMQSIAIGMSFDQSGWEFRDMFMPIIDFLSSYFSPGILLGLSLFSVIGALKLFDLVIGLFQVTYTDDNKKKITTFVGLLPWKKRKDPLADCVCIAEAGKHFWRKLRDLVVKREFIFIEWVRNPIFAFLFGAFLTLLTMSALASEAILLPFYLSRVIQIRTVIFFILGAGTTRIIDTLIVALMSQSTSAIEIILIILGLSFVVSVLCIVLMKWFVPVAVNSVQFLSRNVWRFLVFLLFVIGVPLGILLL